MRAKGNIHFARPTSSELGLPKRRNMFVCLHAAGSAERAEALRVLARCVSHLCAHLIAKLSRKKHLEAHIELLNSNRTKKQFSCDTKLS